MRGETNTEKVLKPAKNTFVVNYIEKLLFFYIACQVRSEMKIFIYKLYP